DSMQLRGLSQTDNRSRTEARGMQRKLKFSTLAAQCAILASALFIYHLVLTFLMTHYGLRLGAVSAKLVPLYAYWHPHLKVWLIVPLVVIGAYVWFLRRTHIATSLADRTAAVTLSFFFL